MQQLDSGEHAYREMKIQRSIIIQRMTLLTAVKQVGEFNGEYQGELPFISICETVIGKKEDERVILNVTFSETKDIGSYNYPVNTNQGMSTIKIDETKKT
jgi:hypothetical protein